MRKDHEELIYQLTVHPRKKVTSEFEDRVRFLVSSVTRHACYFTTRSSVFDYVERLAIEEFGYYPEYSKKQKELLDVLDYCCIYPQPYKPMT